MRYRKYFLLQLSVLIATVSGCHRRVDMEAMLADNPRATINRRDAPTGYYDEGNSKKVISSRGGHVVYTENDANSPKTVILLQPHAPPPPPPQSFEGPLPSFLPGLNRHLQKHLHHAQKFLRHRMKKLHRFFRDFLGEEPVYPSLPLSPVPVAYEPPPPPIKIGIPAVKVEAYEEAPPKIVKVVHRHPHHHEPPNVVTKYVEPQRVVKVVESYGSPPTPPRDVVKYVQEPHPVVKYVKHHHDPPLPPQPSPTKIIKYIQEHHHHHSLPPPPPPPTNLVHVESYDREPPPSAFTRYVESYEPDGSKVVRVIKENPYRSTHHAPPPPPPEGPKTRITIVTGDDDREPPVVYRERVPASPSPPPYYRRHHVNAPPPPPIPSPAHFIPSHAAAPPPPPPEPPRPEPIVYSRGSSGAAPPPPPPPPPPYPSFQPTAKAFESGLPDIRQTVPLSMTPQPILQASPTTGPVVHQHHQSASSPPPISQPQSQSLFAYPPPPTQFPGPLHGAVFHRQQTQHVYGQPQHPVAYDTHPHQPSFGQSQPSVFSNNQLFNSLPFNTDSSSIF